jgi:hypothetical protein
LSVVWTCDGKIIKATDCIIKVAIIRGNITWRSFALRDLAYKQICAWQPLLPSMKGLSFTFMHLLLCKSQSFLPYSFFYFLFLQASCGEERSTHTYPVGYEWAWVIIVDITLEVNTLGGETISPYLSMCPIETFCSWVYPWTKSFNRTHIKVGEC